MTRTPSDARWRWVLGGLLALNAALLLYVIFKPLLLIDNLTLLDDTYLALGVSRNIALGKGPLQGLEPTNGFQPLWVFLMVPVYWIWRTDLMTPIRVALLLLGALNTATLALLAHWIRCLTGSILIPLIIGLIWICDYYVIYESLNGLETELSVFFMTACFMAFHRLVDGDPQRPGVKRTWILGILLGLATMARVDNVILATVLGGSLVVWRARAGVGTREIAAQLARLAIAIFVVNLPWWLYSWHWTGSILPISGSAVRFRGLAHVHSGESVNDYVVGLIWRAVKDIWRTSWELLVAIAVLAGFLYFVPATKEPRSSASPSLRWTLAAMGCWAVSLFLAYTCYVFGPWYFQRYLHPLVVPLLIALAVMLRRALDRWQEDFQGRVALAACALLVALPILGSLTSRTQFRNLFTFQDTQVFGYMNVGLWARDFFKPGTRIGAIQSGALAYFTPELTVVNLDGVVNRDALQALSSHTAMDYVERTGLQYLVNWPSDSAFLLSHSAAGAGQQLNDLGPVEGFRSFNQVWHIYEVH